MAIALVLSGDAAAVDDKTIFCSEYVPNAQAESHHQKWLNQNPGEKTRWEGFRNAICASGNPTPPAMLTARGRGLVAAGKMALPEPPPPPTTTGSTTTTTTQPTTTTTTTTEPPPPGGTTLAPGSSLDAAYDGASCGQVFDLLNGSWPSQTLTGTKSCAGNPIVFREAAGARVIIDSLNVDGADYITFRGFETGYQDADHQHGIFAGPGSSFIRFEQIDAGNVSTWFASDITVIGGDYGPCRAPASGCWLNNIDVSDRVLIDGAVFHDYNYTPSCVQSADCHWRALYVNGAKGFTLRNSTVRDSVFSPWTTISGPDASPRGNSDVLIENNQFGHPVQSPSDRGWEAAWCQNGSQPSYRNYTVRFNSFARGALVSMPGWYDGEFGCRTQNVRAYGNLMGERPECPSTQTSTVGVSYSYNVYAGNKGFTCGSGDVNIGGSSMPFYKVDTQAPTPGNFDLVGPTFAADNRVPSSMGCPATDAAGRPRGVGGFCDAGAFER